MKDDNIYFGFDFGFALMCIKSGYCVSREGWNGKGQYVKLQVPDEHSKMSSPYMYLHNAQDKNVPWVPSTGDLFANDWRIVNDRDSICSCACNGN